MTKLEWTSHRRQTRRRKYQPILERVADEQSLHPGQWAEIARFTNPATARDCAYNLRRKFAGFQIRAEKDNYTLEGVVFARYVGDIEDE